jgi:lipid A 3-O-deacylase
MTESPYLVNFANLMKKCIYFVFFLFLFSQCNLSEQNMNGDNQSDGSNHMPSGQVPSETSLHDKSDIESQKLKKVNINKSSQTPTRNKKRKSKPVNISMSSRVINNDSLRIARLASLRKRKIDIDLNEPVSKNYLLSSVENGKYASMIMLSGESFLKINFDNDILNYTDRFYTNGIKFDFISPALQQFPLSRLMIPYWRNGTNYYGVSLVQNMYTPSTTKVDGILFGDRPYASYLYFGTFKITNDPIRKFRQTSELDLGVIGPYSFGEYIQKSFHNEVPTNTVPLGWEYQIKNDLVLNYNYSVEKGIYSRENFDFTINGTGSLGSLYTNISGGFLMRTGIQNPYFFNLGQAKRRINKEYGLKNTQVIFFITSRGKLVGYDATLQGGLFNRSSVYNIDSQDISRFIYQGSAGLTFIYGGFRIDIEQFLLSPEFQSGWWHKWVHMAFTFSL